MGVQWRLRIFNEREFTMTAAARLFSVSDFIRPSDGEPVRSVVLETEESVIVVWYVRPGQEIATHVHSHGQDTWAVLSGSADYYQGRSGVVTRLKAGEIAVAKPGQVYGAINTDSTEPFTFVFDIKAMLPFSRLLITALRRVGGTEKIASSGIFTRSMPLYNQPKVFSCCMLSE
jgi:quercetin dioxygenase-like cupin family protein